jgi:hypothetical protein
LVEHVSQTIGRNITNYIINITASLTQVLADDEYTYLYGAGRIAQYSETDIDYFLADALGSVRQLADAARLNH